MSKNAAISRGRARLMAEDPHCAYCGREVVYFNPGPKITKENPLPVNFATIEHVYSRLNGPRPAQGKWILACKQCNEKRGADEERMLPVQELWRRCGRFPRHRSSTG